MNLNTYNNFFDSLINHISFRTSIKLGQLIRFARVPSHVDDIESRYKVLTVKLLIQEYRYHKLLRRFQNFIDGLSTLCLHVMSHWKHFIGKAFRNLNFMATWCINSEKIFNKKNDFP